MKNTTDILTFDSKTKFQDTNIQRLGVLKVAGTQLILEPKTDLIELLKLTLFDLALKQVLVIMKMVKKAHPRDKHLREYIIVKTGKNFEKYTPSGFEEYFTKRINSKNYFQLKLYLRVIYKEIPSEYKYKKEIISDLKIKDLFKGDLLSFIFSWLRVTPAGESLKKDITTYLNEVDKNIRNLIDNEPEKALELLQFLQGHIFLLKNLKFDLLEKLKGITVVPTTANDESYDDWYCWDLNILLSDVFETLESVDDYFDPDISGDWSGDFDGDFGGDFDF